ncbi:hypothetical protein N7448_002002 [Penicillium atrosanguineum]|nr:hypothetical protein N7448_002002 [Penicillium atrosanguineum]
MLETSLDDNKEIKRLITSTGYKQSSMMSGSGTASSTPPSTGPFSAGESGGSRTVEDNEGLGAGRHTDFRVADEGDTHNGQYPGGEHRRGSTQDMEDVPELSRQTSHPDVAPSRAGPMIDLTRPMPSHPARHRKRRMVSLGENPRLQRTRSGEAPSREAITREAFPHRSISMIVPSSGAGSSTVGSSYATAIDITSSPPDQGRRNSVSREEQGHPHHPAEGTPRLGAGNAGSPASSRRASRQSVLTNHDMSDFFGQGHELSAGQGGTSQYDENPEAETDLPRWQPDSEVSECPICGTVFKLWYRKHHCRKCGRVVCAACSPHRITIPRQYIVRPPDSSSLPTSPPIPLPRQIVDLTGEEPVSSSLINPALGGGEEVRLCNPCVPDPNPHPLNYAPVRPHGHRSTQSLSSTMLPLSARQSAIRPLFTIAATPTLTIKVELMRTKLAVAVVDSPAPPALHSSGAAWPAPAQSTSTRRAPPPVSERDLCPICGALFPPLSADAPDASREAHIVHCIESRVSPAPQDSSTLSPSLLSPSPASAVARMVTFMATEKDCLSGLSEAAECSICMEDYEVGQDLVRLECLCKFHRGCIVDWFKRKPECPLHKVSS